MITGTAATGVPLAKRRLRVLVLSHYYAPELGAPQTRLRETVRDLGELGHDVRVLTGPPHYPDGVVRRGYRWLVPARETIDGVPVLRLPMLPRPNHGFLDRLVDQASFAAVATAAAGPMRWADVLLVESPPLFLGATAAFHRRTGGRPYVFHVADPWPDVAVATAALRNRFAIRMGYALERIAYANASIVTTVTPGLVRLLEAKPGAAGKTRLLPNGVDVSRFQADADRKAARSSLGWPVDPFIVVYAGTVGLAQGLATLVDAAERIARPGILVNVIGEGRERDRLARAAAARNVANLRFLEPVPADEVPTVLAAADAVVTLLRADPIYGHALPTKLVEGLASGRPVIVSAAGEASQVVADARAGVTCPPEDAGALAAAIEKLASAGAASRTRMGRAGRKLSEQTFDRRRIVRQLAGYLAEAAGAPPPRSP